MDQSTALKELESGKNVFLTGKAGTGKTYTLTQFVKKKREENRTVIITAPTGIAAINAGWATIHSTFKMFGNYPQRRTPNRQKVDWRRVDVLVIDEISMVGPDYLDQIDFILKFECRNDKLFWGIQVILVGDAKQLPPVYAEYTEKDRQDIAELKDAYGTLTFDKAHSFEWFTVCDLDEVKRTNNPKLIELLNCIRDDDLSAIRKFNQWSGSHDTVHLYPYNNMVDSHNSIELSKIKSDKREYHASYGGKFDVKNSITPELLVLKVWARVMVTKNMDCWLVNGDMWEVRKLTEDTVTIYSDRFETEFELTESEWKMVEYDGTSEVPIGYFRQIPLKLWFALTIHKSQWLTLEDVCVHYVKGISKELLYVGLSRATNFERLFVKVH